MSDELPDALLDRYFAGECTPAEEAALRQRVGKHDPRRAVRDALHARGNEDRFNSLRAWQIVRGKLDASPRTQSRWATRRVLMRIAASILVIVGGAFLVPRLLSRRAVDGQTLVAMTRVGEVRHLVLSDSTRVTLAPLSELRYPARFGAAARRVSLSGQASFTVAHDASRPFSVRTTRVTARVLGTEFDVRENVADHTVDVVVATGRVWLRTPTDSGSPVLGARQLGHVDPSSGRIIVRTDVSPEQFMGWTGGRVHFERTTLRDVVVELKRWYDVDFIVTDGVLAARTLTADVRVGDRAPLDVLLGAISLAVDARYERVGRSVTMRAR
ncbi:MAG: FecR domain-containing protein [Gemmatimonadota bacterium]